MQQIAIYGAGGFGREVAWLAESCDGAFDVACFVDDDPNLIGKKLNNIPVVDFKCLKERFPGIGVVAAIGSPLVRQRVVEKLAKPPIHNPQITQIHADLALENNLRNLWMEDVDRFDSWQYPVIEDGKPTKYNWVVQHKDNLKLGYKTDIGAFTYINARHGVAIEDLALINVSATHS